MSSPRFVSPFASVLDGPLFLSLPASASEDEGFLAQAIDEAERGLGCTWPNPPVGAVVVRGGRVVGIGHHRAAGQPHAEVVALDDAGRRARGATLYVSLEPCTHFGRTPPCADRVLADGIARVVIGVKDPNPRVTGRGIAKLRRHGVEVTVARHGPVAARARALIAPFASAMARGRPWLVAKVATSLDGKVATATGDSRWITGEPARDLVHRLRARTDGILVGSGTVQRDDPALTVRGRPAPGARNPLRVVVDSRLETSPGAVVYARHARDRPQRVSAAVLHGPQANPVAIAAFAASGVRTIGCTADEHLDLRAGLTSLQREFGLTSLLCEAGPRLLGALLAEDLVDELWWFTAPTLLGGDGRGAVPSLGVEVMHQAIRLSTSVRSIGADALFVGPVTPRR